MKSKKNDKKFNWKKYAIQAAVAVAIALLVMETRGAFDEGVAASERLMAVCDGFSVTALIYLSFGALLWVSSTGFLDIFAYAIKRGAHALIPGAGLAKQVSYYDYKQERTAGRRTRPIYSTLLIGLGLLVVSIILILVWYSL